MNGKEMPKNEKRAFKWFLKSEQNKYNIKICENERKEFEKDLKSAVIAGDATAQNNLGYYYQEGIGTLKDERKSFEWYLKSANAGNVNAQFELGCCYQNGVGTD